MKTLEKSKILKMWINIEKVEKFNKMRNSENVEK